MQARAATIYQSMPAYQAAVPTTGLATFEDVANGQASPFTSGGVAIVGPFATTSPVSSVTYAGWFGSTGTPIQFAMMNLQFGNGFQATFPADAYAAGFIFNAFGGDPLPNDSALDWSLLDAAGRVVEQGSVTVTLGGPAPFPPGFLGLVSSARFRTFVVMRRSISQPGAALQWMVDDIRYARAADAATVPVPASSYATLALTALALVAVAYGGVGRSCR